MCVGPNGFWFILAGPEKAIWPHTHHQFIKTFLQCFNKVKLNKDGIYQVNSSLMGNVWLLAILHGPHYIEPVQRDLEPNRFSHEAHPLGQ